jgi:pilus assembly protein CpaF
MVQIARLQDGSRKIVNITEVAGIAEDQIDVQDIFIFDRSGVTAMGETRANRRNRG